ncbi:hypothetical protein Tco_0349119, partial [Tanacetum coccineum]
FCVSKSGFGYYWLVPLKNTGQFPSAMELAEPGYSADVSEIINIKQEQAAKDKMPKFSATPYDQAVEAKFKQKEILFWMMRESKSYEKHPKHKSLYDALMLSLIQDEDDLDRLVLDLKKGDSSKKTSKGDTLPKSSKTGKSASAKEPVKEATHEVIMGDEELDQENVNDANQPQDGKAAPKYDWFKQPPRPPTDPLTFDELIDTHIDFFNLVKNYLKLDKITKSDFSGPVNNLLKGTCNRCPFDLSKPLPLKGHPGHLTVDVEIRLQQQFGVLKIYRFRKEVYYVNYKDEACKL